MDIQSIRKEFPILHQKVNGKPFIYFDNAASSQKPHEVVEAISTYYETIHANVHRGVHHLSQLATEQFENAREDLRRFINAKHTHEIIFTSGTTDSINLIAQTWGRKFLEAGDEVLVSYMEHHSNIVPWQMICEEKGATLRVVDINEKGILDINSFDTLLSSKTKLVALTHVSNTLGTVNPIKEIIQKARVVGAKISIDGAQAVPHMNIDVMDLDADFYSFSGHKMYGPTGVGILYGKEKLLDAMPPWRGGGEMIERVSFSGTTYNKLPYKFEAGTPNISGVVGLAAAVRWMEKIGIENIHHQENQLLAFATEKMTEVDGIHFFGQAPEKAAVISFGLYNAHHFDVGTLLDKLGIAVRTGHHCTEPLMDWFGIPGTVRASFAVYNTFEEINSFVDGLKRVSKILK